MALVAKILETTLTAGQTTVSFNDSDIPNSLIRVFTTNPDLFPIQQSLSGNVLTVAFEKQSSNIGVALEIVKQGLTVADNLTTESSEQALSAKQGYVLKGLIDNIVIPTVPENITDLDDVAVSDIQDGQVLAWDSVNEKFKNVNQSGGGGFSLTLYDHTDLGAVTLNNNAYKTVKSYTNIPVGKYLLFYCDTFQRNSNRSYVNFVGENGKCLIYNNYSYAFIDTLSDIAGHSSFCHRILFEITEPSTLNINQWGNGYNINSANVTVYTIG